MLEPRRILLAISGGIAAYKAPELVRELRRAGHAVRCALTPEAARITGKEVRLEARGESVELDKSIVEALTEPLVHLVRNAVDHGVESPDEREQAGKARSGTVQVAARPEAGRIVLEVRDDGHGLDYDRILEKARELVPDLFLD